MFVSVRFRWILGRRVRTLADLRPWRSAGTISAVPAPAERPASAVPLVDALIHLSPLLPLGAAIVAFGPLLWLSPVVLLGPLVFGSVLAGRRSIGRSHLISCTELNLTLGVAGLLTYALIWVGLSVSALALLIPLGVLLVLVIAANFVFLTAAGAFRALRAEVIEYPWVVPLRHRLPPLPETGFGQRR